VSHLAIDIRYAASFVVPLVATLFLAPVAGRLARRWGILDHPSDHKFHREATPYLGGLAVAAGLVLVGAFAAGASGQVLTILLCAIAMSFMGFVDDWRTVGPRVKLAVETGAGVALWTVGVRAGLFGVPALDLLVTVAWVIVVTNAFNIVDNMDGVASGIGAIAAMWFFALAAQRGDYLVGSLALAVAGASLGFLRHNYPPARIFLGDAGSLLIGFLLAALALKLDLVGESGVIRSAVPVLILAVPLFDLVLVVISRTRGGRPIYVGGTDHSAHRMASLGWTHQRVATMLYGAAALFGACAVAIARLSDRTATDVVVVCAVVLTGGLVVLLGLERGAATEEATIDLATNAQEETVVMPDVDAAMLVTDRMGSAQPP